MKIAVNAPSGTSVDQIEQRTRPATATPEVMAKISSLRSPNGPPWACSPSPCS